MFFSKKKKDAEKKVAPKTGKQAAAAPSQKKKPVNQKNAPPSAADIREKMADGWLKAVVIFELAGKPKEHIEETMKAYMANIKSDTRVIALKEEYGETEEHDDGIFSTFCEMELLVQDMETLTWLAINFMPASIEVIEPDKPGIDARRITAWLNDLLAKLHETSNILREERGVNANLTKGMNALIKNALIAAVATGPKNLAKLEKTLGIPAAQLEPFVKHLAEKGRLKKKGGTYEAV